MLGKAIKHILNKDKEKDVQIVAKKLHTPFKPQIQVPKTKKRKKSGRTLPLDC